MATKTFDQRIVQTLGICGGAPRIDDHLITVQTVATWYDRLGWSADVLASDYDLDLADIYAALAYYFVSREQVDRFIEKSEAFAEQLRQQTPSLLDQKPRGNA